MYANKLTSETKRTYKKNHQSDQEGDGSLNSSQGSLTKLNDVETQKMLKSRHDSNLLKKRTNNNLLLTAHRGTGPTSVFGPIFPEKYFPENSLPAIKAAILQGADAIEIDIFKSKEGEVIVTHDDEIWRNEFNADRSGQKLPDNETKASYLVGKKTANQLQNIKIGRNGETMPTLAEVMKLVSHANETLNKHKENPIILNIELKDENAIFETLDLLEQEKNDKKNVPVVFCSFKHEALKKLKAEADKRNMSEINIAPGIKTADLFGKDNIDENFALKDSNAKYHKDAMENLKELVEGNGFNGYDGILWDLRNPIVKLAISGKKSIHASTSDFRQYSDSRDFSLVLLELSKHVEIFFKCDNVDDARKVLLESSILISGIGIQMIYKRLPNGEDCFYFYRSNSQDNSHFLKKGARKPLPYSKLGRD
ncbi:MULTISPECIES: glycerophosphodiester phosphodiesterase family protein [Photorhabdus]|uniref:Glycerophosphodiester phosphodiesterase family protein n=1 Tax=Photorhabdus bodei TaxID=2029681 RepID=A0AAW6BQ84_9GAMM|nr:glycerophosphodiester phosphodiesterase family protein [Photorhabdus bodei]MDB6375278.1 glycerophosphodiester phosphodiesterase family protein [Photorhabdus bodei]